MGLIKDDISRLLGQLNQTGLTQTNQDLYQVIKALINSLNDINVAAGSIGSSGSSGHDGKDGIPGFIFNRNSDDRRLLIPGPIGPTGANGSNGIQGLVGPVFFGKDGIDGRPGLNIPVPGPQGPTGAAATWSLISSYSPVSDANKDFIGLAAYSDIRVLLVGLTINTTAGLVNLRVSTDNGSTFLSASGDYVSVLGQGTLINKTDLQFSDTNFTTVAHSGEIIIEGFNLTAPKVSRSNFFNTDGIYLRYMPTGSALNAIRLYSTGGVMNGGTIYVFGR